MGIDPNSQATPESVYNAALALGIANQLTNILRDVGEERGRICLPQHELAQAGLSEEDIFSGRVTDKGRNFIKNQIARAKFFQEAEKDVTELNQASRWPVSQELPETSLGRKSVSPNTMIVTNICCTSKSKS